MYRSETSESKVTSANKPPLSDLPIGRASSSGRPSAENMEYSIQYAQYASPFLHPCLPSYQSLLGDPSRKETTVTVGSRFFPISQRYKTALPFETREHPDNRKLCVESISNLYISPSFPSFQICDRLCPSGWKDLVNQKNFKKIKNKKKGKRIEKKGKDVFVLECARII